MKNLFLEDLNEQIYRFELRISFLITQMNCTSLVKILNLKVNYEVSGVSLPRAHGHEELFSIVIWKFYIPEPNYKPKYIFLMSKNFLVELRVINSSLRRCNLNSVHRVSVFQKRTLSYFNFNYENCFEQQV